MSAIPIYRQVLGEDFDQLPRMVREFHSVLGDAKYSGRVVIDGPDNSFGRLIAWCSGLPRVSTEQAFEFSMQADENSETWRRHFPDGDMVSLLRAVDGCLVERLGVFQLGFRLDVATDKLSMLLDRVTAFGIPCPSILFPRVTAEEYGDDERFYFNIEMHMPLVGRVVAYKGYLDMISAMPMKNA